MNKKTYDLKCKKLGFKNIDYSKIPKSNAKPNQTTINAIHGSFYRIR